MSTFKHKITALAAVVLMLAGCIENDIPYPRIQPNVTKFVVEGQEKPSEIDSAALAITVYLPENADIWNVRIDSLELSCGQLCDSTALTEPINLSSPYKLKVKLYQEYTWTITAIQSIERYFSIEGQLGTSTIDVPGHRVIAYIPKTTDIHAVKVLGLQLGSSASTITPDIVGKTIDFSTPVEVELNEHGHTSIWTIYVEESEATVMTTAADGWSNVAWVYGQAQAGKDNGVEYREKGADEWIRVPAEWITHTEGDFVARIIHLQPETEYEARTYSDEDYGNILSFTTEGLAELPNGSMDNWWLDGKIWCPWAEGATPYWGTGNKGATTLGPSNSVPTDDTSSGTGLAAMLETRFVGIGILGKLAAGNIFTGDYVRTDGTNGVLSFGRDFHLHPTRLGCYVKYHSAPISSTSAGFDDWKGRPDTCSVWIALIDMEKPLEIRTNPKDRNLFDPNADYVVGYGRFDSGSDIEHYTHIKVDINYTSTSRIPKYIIVVASASKYGDYFTGGNGSVLCVDNFELEYDY